MADVSRKTAAQPMKPVDHDHDAMEPPEGERRAVRVRQPLLGEYDVIMRAANDDHDEVERFIREHLAPRGPRAPSKRDERT